MNESDGKKASICESALSAMTSAAEDDVDVAAAASSPNLGRPVNYAHLIDDLTTRILPLHFGVPLDSEMRRRISSAASVYSKGRGDRAGTSWEADSERKEGRATDAIRGAADLFLEGPYQRLEMEASREY